MASSATNVMSFPRTEAYSDQIAGGFWRMRSDKTFTDVSINCNGTTFQCHRVIIAACSPVLEAMLLSDMAEAEKREISLDSIPSIVLEHLLQYMYTGHVDIPDELLLSTVKGCDYLHLTELKESCLSRSLTILDPNNVISWFKVADDLCHDELKTRCSEILASSLVDVAKGTEFLELSLAEVSSYLTDAQQTDVDSDDLLDATIAWVDHKRNVRQDHLMNLVQTINLSRCSIECLEDQTQSHAALLDSQPGVSRVLMAGCIEVAKQQPTRQKRSRPQGNKTVQERSRTTLAVLGGHAVYGPVNQMCWHKDPESQQLHELSAIPSKCSSWLSVCEVPGGFVVTGGSGSVMCTMFLSTTKSWAQLQSLLAPRCQHASINVNRKILVFGGDVSGSASASVHSLELNGSEWKEDSDLPHLVGHPAVARVNNSIYLMDTATKELFQQDVGSKVWSRKAKCPGKSYAARMTSARGQLLVAGGWNESIFVSYNPDTDTWTAGKAPALRHVFGALLFCDKKLFLIGGRDEDRAEEYDFTTESWSVCEFRVPQKLWNLYAVSLDM